MRMIIVLLIVVSIFLSAKSVAQTCSLTASDNTGAEVLAVLGSPGSCDVLEIPDGVVINIGGDWDLTAYDITLELVGDGSQLNFDNSNEDVKLSANSVFEIEPTNTDGLSASNEGNKRIFIGTAEFKGMDFDEIIAAGGATENGYGLPIVLGSFTSMSFEKSVELEWETISEENFDFFSIERSDDGKGFYEIGTVPGHGNSNIRSQYSFVDENPLFGMSYYRLNAIDYDGSYEKFHALPVEYVPNDLQVSIYPNPGNGGDIKLKLGLPTTAKLKKVSVYDPNGKQIFEKILGVGKNDINLQQHLRKGLYFAKIQIDNYSTTKKLIIN